MFGLDADKRVLDPWEEPGGGNHEQKLIHAGGFTERQLARGAQQNRRQFENEQRAEQQQQNHIELRQLSAACEATPISFPLVFEDQPYPSHVISSATGRPAN